MFIIDPHCHMVSRTTADYETMALSGVVAISEPAFWAGYDRSPAGFIDYYRQLTETEPKRAAQFGMQHYSWICRQSEGVRGGFGEGQGKYWKEMPRFLSRPTVLGVGEIGLDKNTRPMRRRCFKQHLQMAIDCFQGSGTGGRGQAGMRV